MKAIMRGGPLHRKIRAFPKIEQKIIVDVPAFPPSDIVGKFDVTFMPRRRGVYSRVIDPVPNKDDTYIFVWLGWKPVE